VDSRPSDLHPRELSDPVYVDISAVLLDWSSIRCLLYRRSLLYSKLANLLGSERKLTSQDIDLVLQRVDTGGWRLIYQVKQRWVKNNRDPKNIQYAQLLLRPRP
jgi:hypothetical protein